ncbi:MAG: response regulator [Coprobacter sp.]|nr:response regulator [Coprobacter sp.]
MNRTLLTICCIIGCLLSSAAQDNSFKYYFRNISRKDGLSQTDIKAILQDSYGFMWFGTRNKLNRYDGHNFRIFDCYDAETNTRNNNISSLFEDAERHLWIGTDNGVYVFDPMTEKFSFINDSTETGVTMNDWVSAIKSDNEGNMWIILPNQGVFRYRKGTPLRLYTFGNCNIPSLGTPQCMIIDQSGRLWIGTNGHGIYLYNKTTDSFTQYLGNQNGETLTYENIYKMCDYGEDIIIGVHEGKLRKFNKRKNTLTDVDAPEVHYKVIREIACYDEEIWVGTQAGVYVVNEQKKSVDHIYNDPMCSYSLSDNQIGGGIYRDDEGGIWIGTNMGGINYLPRHNIEFRRHIPLNRKYSISSKRTRELVEDAKGNIWIGTENAGVNIYNPKTGQFRNIERDTRGNLSSEKTLALLRTDNNIWVGFFKNGLDIINGDNLSSRHYTGEQLGLNESSIYAMCEDSKGNIWIGNGWGVYVGNRRTMQFERQSQFGDSYIFDIIEDADGHIWVATMGKGVFHYNPHDGSLQHFTHNINDSTSLSSNSVSNITETMTGEIWLSTDRGGICRYNKESNNFTSFSVKKGLPDDTAYKILEDKDHNLWFGTNNGLVKFNPQTYTSQTYTTNDGLPGNQFNYKSALATGSGLFYFGCSEGLISFDPYKSSKNRCIPQIVITKLLINNEEILPRGENSPLEKSILYTDELTLHYSRASIGFEFAALSFTEPQANMYAYKMENVDDEWNYTHKIHTATYANLSPGKYTFKVRGANNAGVWNNDERTLRITILPPWWSSPLAYSGYIALIIISVATLFLRYKRKSEARAKGRLILIENEKEKELYRAKVEFFTHIAHEIRTPVTLINGPLEQMEKMDIDDTSVRKCIKIMRKSTSELLSLINQLLDFRKVDSNKMQMNFAPVNTVEILNDVYQQFLSTLPEKKEMSLILPEKDVYISADRHSLTKIFNNLFSNASRYSDVYIEIRVQTNGENVDIQFINDGDVIPEEQRERIFDPFYQMKKNENQLSSSGIGLSLARSLVEMHHGKLVYQEQEGLNCFVLSIPTIPAPVITTPETDAPNGPEENENKLYDETILLVEDNAELLSFLVDALQPYFAIEQATDGVMALEILESKNIDLVISDIMMPRMDGFELCRNIKSNIEYSHIPVILLTAKNDLDSKVKGVKIGAEAYIEKPFSFEYLLAQISSLIENRKREKEAFMRKPSLFASPSNICKADEELLNRIISVIEENLTNVNFGVEMLSEVVCLSRSSLHRKIKALAGTSPTDFIRLVRLKKSVELINEGSYRIGEVCFLVGINSPSYFIKLFQKQFGMTPKEFEKQARQNNEEKEK